MIVSGEQWRDPAIHIRLSIQPYIYIYPFYPKRPSHPGCHNVEQKMAGLVSSVQSLSCVWLFATLWTAAGHASLSITNSQSLLKLMSTESVMPSNHPILCHPLLLITSIVPSIRVFSNESVLRIRWPKYCSFSFSIIPLGWTSWISLQSKGLKSLLQYHSSKASILWDSAFFRVQLSYPYTTTGKTIALTRRTFVGKVMSAF